jgi:hypothetical protein
MFEATGYGDFEGDEVMARRPKRTSEPAPQ